MKALIHRENFLRALAQVGGVVPARSPKPILQNVVFVADLDEGSTLLATDLEIGVRARVLGVHVDRPGSVVLSPAKIGDICNKCHDESLLIEASDGRVEIKGLRSKYKLPTEDADLFPVVPNFDRAAYHEIAAADLKRMIRRTAFATDVESTRYALGGVLWEPSANGFNMVGTDGRRLAKAECPAEFAGELPEKFAFPVVPVKALKIIDRNLHDDDPPAHVAIEAMSNGTASAVLIRTERATIYARAVEGRFPAYGDVFPGRAEATIPFDETGAREFREAIEQASITTSEESRGVDFTFAPGLLSLKGVASDVGESEIETPISYAGPPIEITFDPRYLIEPLRVIGDIPIRLELIDHKNPAVFRTEDGYSYVAMPLTRDR